MNPKIKIAIFDMDGTIFKSFIDWKSVKKDLRVGENSTILDSIMGTSTFDRSKIRKLEEIEFDNTSKTVPFPGFLRFYDQLKTEGIISVLITNNSKKNTDFLLKKHSIYFDYTITREMNMWKPKPDSFRFVFKKFDVSPEMTISIGDSEYDIQASISAGVKEIYIKSEKQGYSDNKGNKIVYFIDYSDLYDICFKEKNVDMSTF